MGDVNSATASGRHHPEDRNIGYGIHVVFVQTYGSIRER
jgi:hypothetical protein